MILIITIAFNIVKVVSTKTLNLLIIVFSQNNKLDWCKTKSRRAVLSSINNISNN